MGGGDELPIGANGTSPQVRLVAQDRLANIIIVRNLTAVEEQAVLELYRVADDATVANNDIFSDVGAWSNAAVAANDGWACKTGW